MTLNGTVTDVIPQQAGKLRCVLGFGVFIFFFFFLGGFARQGTRFVSPETPVPADGNCLRFLRTE